MGWIQEEFNGIDLGDNRLNNRLMSTGQSLYEKPESSINEACEGWSETKAAYRFFDNEKVVPKKILDIHRHKTVERMQGYETVLAIQDTTFFNYDNHESTVGLGIINSNKVPVQGLLAHNTLITTTEGLPLGLFDQKIYARKNKQKRSPHYAKIEDKESVRWIEPLRTLSEHKPKEQKCVIVADRESDIFELMHGCLEQELDFIVRSTHDRTVGDRKRRWGTEKNANEYLLEFVAKLEVKALLELEFDDKLLKRKRVAKLELRFSPVIFPAPWRLDYGIDGPSQKNKKRTTGSRLKVKAYVVEVKELSPPKGGQKLHWRLITSLPIFNIEDAKRIVDFYKVRWTIEIYHRVLKSGCQIEARRLETFQRLERCITLLSIIAWRLLWMTKINQAEPDSTCAKILSLEEWQTLYRIANKTQNLPESIPTTRQAIRWMAKLGGFLGRNSDGEPGITTVWRGWQKLNLVLSLKTYG